MITSGIESLGDRLAGFIGGEWIEIDFDGQIAVEDPSTEERIGAVADMSAATVDLGFDDFDEVVNAIQFYEMRQNLATEWLHARLRLRSLCPERARPKPSQFRECLSETVQYCVGARRNRRLQ